MQDTTQEYLIPTEITYNTPQIIKRIVNRPKSTVPKLSRSSFPKKKAKVNAKSVSLAKNIALKPTGVDHNSTFGLNISDLRKIYISKCQDLSIPFFPDQEKRLFNFCWLHFKDRKFCMSDSGIGTITAKTIGDILKNNPNFAYVDLSKNTIKDTGAIDLVKKIRKSFFVVHLNLSSNDITPEGSKTILSLLHKNESLVSLNLSSHEGLHRNRLCVEGAEVIGKTLAHNTVLSYLDVSGTSLGPDGLCYLLKGLENNLTLYSLGISNNNLGSKVVERLCAVLATTDLRDLYLANNKIFDEGCEYLGTLLSGANKGPCTLAKLDLSSNEITTKGLCILLEAVRINTLLNTLVFQKNYLVKGLSDALLPFLSDNTAVQVLDFSNCKLKCEGLSGIGEGLSKNKTLTNLNLSENLIKDRGVENLSHGLLKNKSIITLDLSRNQIKNKGAVSLSKVLKCNNTLQALLLRDNSIKDLGGEALCESLRYNLNINCLSLDVNPMSYKFINDVKELLKHKKNLKSKLLVPKLQEIIEKTSKDTGKSKDIQTIYSIINQKVKDQLEAENKYKIQHEKLKALRETEREKLEEIKNEYKTIKAKSFALSTEIESLHLQLNKTRLQQEKSINEMSTKIGIVNAQTKQIHLGNSIKETVYTFKCQIQVNLKKYKDELVQAELEKDLAKRALEQAKRALELFKIRAGDKKSEIEPLQSSSFFPTEVDKSFLTSEKGPGNKKQASSPLKKKISLSPKKQKTKVKKSKDTQRTKSSSRL